MDIVVDIVVCPEGKEYPLTSMISETGRVRRTTYFTAIKRPVEPRVEPK